MKKYLPVFLFILAIVFLIPGLTQPLMTITATVDKQQMLGLATTSLFPPDQNNNFVQNMLQSVLQQLQIEGDVVVFESTRSLLQTMNELISHNHEIVGLLIGLFGVIIPLTKIILTLTSLLLRAPEDRNLVLKISSQLSKWSMSDVFMMAIIVAFLAINANESSIETVRMNAELGPGFYFFTAYCLIAIAAGQLFEKQTNFIKLPHLKN